MRLLALVSLLAAAHAQGTRIFTKSGAVQGGESENGLFWKGIPFAQPANTTRFQPSVLVEPWQGVKDAQEFGPACSQSTCGMHPALCPAVMSEDCLTLNIYAPRTAAQNSSSLPVVVWIFGGGNTVGSAGVEAYDGGVLASTQNVIVVTVNYRLGALGYLAIEGLSQGQFGVLDQRLALQWINENIEFFGGNSSLVTIFGWSAGADSVLFHLVSQPSWPLFQHAIIHSSSGANEYFTLEEGMQFGEIFAQQVGCNPPNITCFEALPIETILSAQTNVTNIVRQNQTLSISMMWAPYVDGIQLRDKPMNLFKSGLFSRVPVMIGDVSAEQQMYVYESYQTPMSQALFDQLVSAIFTFAASEIEQQYPISSQLPIDARPQLTQIKSDYIYVCPNRHQATSMLQYQPGKVFVYWFNHSYEEPDAWGPFSPFCNGYACHGEDLPFIFGTAAAFGFNFSSDEIALQQSVQSFWGSFAHFGNPNRTTNTWTAFNSSDFYMQLRTPSCEMTFSPRNSFCDFWDAVGYIF